MRRIDVHAVSSGERRSERRSEKCESREIVREPRSLPD
jgi:hypothetical protein